MGGEPGAGRPPEPSQARAHRHAAAPGQTFRDIYRTETLAIGQRLKILSLTFLFSDLKDSTELYERVSGPTAFDLVNEHFRLLQEIIASERGPW